MGERIGRRATTPFTSHLSLLTSGHPPLTNYHRVRLVPLEGFAPSIPKTPRINSRPTVRAMLVPSAPITAAPILAPVDAP